MIRDSATESCGGRPGAVLGADVRHQSAGAEPRLGLGHESIRALGIDVRGRGLWTEQRAAVIAGPAAFAMGRLAAVMASR